MFLKLKTKVHLLHLALVEIIYMLRGLILDNAITRTVKLTCEQSSNELVKNTSLVQEQTIMLNNTMRNKVETTPSMMLMRRMESSLGTQHTRQQSSTLSQQGPLPPVYCEAVVNNDSSSLAKIKNNTGDFVTDIQNNQLHYLNELEVLCKGICNSIDFELTFVDDVVPTDNVVREIIEKRDRVLINLTRTTISNSEGKISSNIKTAKQSRGKFTTEDVLLYITEFEHYVNSLQMTLAPFAKDRIMHLWKEAARCYFETKKLDRQNDYLVRLRLVNGTPKTKKSWFIEISAKSKPVTVDAKKSTWETLESHAFTFT